MLKKIKKTADNFRQNTQIQDELPSVEYELDFTKQLSQGETPFSWCKRYGLIDNEHSTASTIKYKGEPKNQGKSFKFKVRYGFHVVTQPPAGKVEGLYCKFRIIHVDSTGAIWWVEDECDADNEELIFETTLHQHG